ncbi:MAG: HIT domain-containing protein [Pirellulales bacterium]
MNDERLWAPWRLEYVSGGAADEQPLPAPIAWRSGADEKCFLCRAAADYQDSAQVDQRLLVAARTELAMVVLNRYPYSNGHLMIAPRRHVAQLADMTDAEHLACIDFLARMTGILTDQLRAEGFNIGLNLGRVAGAGCPGHLHWHIVPRWVGDSNFMTVLSGTRVIPQSLDALWELLTKSLTDAAQPE